MRGATTFEALTMTKAHHTNKNARNYHVGFDDINRKLLIDDIDIGIDVARQV